MPRTGLRQKLIEEIKGLPTEKVREVANFVDYLSLKEDDWFVEYINRRGAQAKIDKKRDRKFTSLAELQKPFK